MTAKIKARAPDNSVEPGVQNLPEHVVAEVVEPLANALEQFAVAHDKALHVFEEGGGLASVIETLVSRDHLAEKYKTDLAAGKFLLVVKGSQDEVDLAKSILAQHATHEGLETHTNGD